MNYLSPPLHPACERVVILKKCANPAVSEQMCLQLQHSDWRNYVLRKECTLSYICLCNLQYTKIARLLIVFTCYADIDLDKEKII
jgi:hypothetical protein